MIFYRLNHSLCHVKSSVRYNTHLKLSKSCLNQFTSTSNYWWRGNNDGDSLEGITIIDDKGNVNSKGNDKSLTVSQFGDNSPKLNPVLTIPVTRKPVFPNFISSITLRDEKTIDAIASYLESSRNSSTPPYVGVFLRTSNNGDTEHALDTLNATTATPEVITNMSQIHKVGTFAQITNIIRTLPDDSIGTTSAAQLLLMGHRRITLDEVTSFGPPVYSKVIHWKKSMVPLDKQSPALKAYINEVLAAARELIKLNPLAQEHLQQYIARIELSDPFKLADFAAAMTTSDAEDLQRVLAASDAEERLSIALELLTKEREMAKLQKEISRQVEEKMSKHQREYLLREQLKSIKNELGIEKDDKDELLEKYSTSLKLITQKEFVNKKEILKTIQEEMKKLQNLEKNSPEFNVTRSYLDWLISIPHGLTSDDKLILKQAKEVLDNDHYGLEDIKKRILEFIAVGKLNGSVSGKIICFIGPPGVGKTSIAKSIASALGRQFYRFSVGGLTDIAEIKGHRRTYIGAMPGKPVLCLKSTGVMNPLILIDEVDKLGRGYSGDPASALLELLDPNQNSSFVDHYLDIPLDFSNVLFVCTANDESTIPGPLRDRMEIFRLSGYDIPEKVAIASKYLVPKALKEAGLLKIKGFHVDITLESLEFLVRNYCRESGVRSLEKHIEKIARKVAFDTVGSLESNAESNESQDKSVDAIKSNEKIEPLHIDKTIQITQDNLKDYVGKPKYTQDTIYDSDRDEPLPVGVVMGLAWNPLGGSPVYVETAAIPTQYSETNSGNVNIITGQLGSVMKESVNIAYTFARKFVSQRDSENKFFNSNTLHVHVPEGAVEKDGPSAGITMATSLISIATNRPLKPRLAMTGELSLTGKVLPVGGIKEKTLAARRSGATTVILPAGNKRDFDELPKYVQDCVTVYFANTYEDVYKIAFENIEVKS